MSVCEAYTCIVNRGKAQDVREKVCIAAGGFIHDETGRPFCQPTNSFKSIEAILTVTTSGKNNK